jgi:uncharacterized protein
MIKELIEHIVKSLVEKPESVVVNVVKKGEASAIEIAVSQIDRGKLIGKEGQTIKTLRSLVGIITPAGKKVTVDIAS